MFNCEFDISDFLQMSGKAKVAVAEGLIAGVDFGMSELHRAITKSLMGVRHRYGTPSPYPGKLPVTRITANLSRAVISKRLHPIAGVVFVDSGSAPYAIPVHDGTRFMKARPFVRESSNERREAIMRRMHNEVKVRLNRL